MKKLLITTTATLACVAAFAQGRITFQNDSLHLVYFTTDTAHLVPADLALAGRTTLATGAQASSPSGAVLRAELWGGSTSSSLSLQATTTMDVSIGSDGIIATDNFTGVGTVAGVANFFRVEVYDVSAGSYAAASTATGKYYGETAIFTTVPSTSSTSYNSIVVNGGKPASTWLPGSQNEDLSLWGPGARGAISLQANVPEPTSLALAGLGAAAMLIFRRRK